MERLSAAVDAGPAIAEIDTDRMRRTGHPEVVFGQGKEPDDIVDILGRLARANQPGLVTRLTDEKAQHIMEQLPDAKWHRRARVLHLPAPGHELQPQVRGTIVIACAGTSDLPVAEEAAVMAEAFGHPVERIWDVGVAGLQRILNHQNSLQSASVVIVVAGMEGALASVVAGLVSCPVVAVPTSVGYGASFQGLAALLGMLNACATGVSVVNIDNGFGAAMMAMRINEVRG
jgi:hypothetical protein